MISPGVFLMALAVLGVSAKPQPNNSFQTNTFKIINGCASSVPGVKTHVLTSVVENPTVTFPSFTQPTTVSQSCHCLRTLVRPQLRNEIITVPTVDRIVRTVATPVVETVESTPIETFTQPIITGVFQNDGSTMGESNNRLFGEEKGRSFASGSLNKSNGGSCNMISQPTITTFHNLNGKNLLSSGPIFSSNSGCLTKARILTF